MRPSGADSHPSALEGVFVGLSVFQARLRVFCPWRVILSLEGDSIGLNKHLQAQREQFHPPVTFPPSKAVKRTL